MESRRQGLLRPFTAAGRFWRKASVSTRTSRSESPPSTNPIRLVYLHLDYCGNVFGTSPCLATGTPCFNTWKTCKYLSAFDNVGKTYKYSEVDAALPFKGVRPYVKSVKLLPTEIKTNLTVNARVSVTMVDEMDRDIDTDPYLTAKGFGA